MKWLQTDVLGHLLQSDRAIQQMDKRGGTSPGSGSKVHPGLKQGIKQRIVTLDGARAKNF